MLFFALQQKRLRGRSGRSRNVVFSQDRGRYVKPMIPKGEICLSVIVLLKGRGGTDIMSAA